jgi:hypothetical protein
MVACYGTAQLDLQGVKTRKSAFETFGVEGLLAGLTVQYNPPQPTFR